MTDQAQSPEPTMKHVKTSMFRNIVAWCRNLFRWKRKSKVQKYNVNAPKPIPIVSPVRHIRGKRGKNPRRFYFNNTWTGRGGEGCSMYRKETRCFGMFSRIKPLYFRGRRIPILGNVKSL